MRNKSVTKPSPKKVRPPEANSVVINQSFTKTMYNAIVEMAEEENVSTEQELVRILVGRGLRMNGYLRR